MNRTTTRTAAARDPIPWLTARWGDALPRKAPERLTPAAGERILDTLTQLVSGLHDDDAPYHVRFGQGLDTMTNLTGKVVHIGSAVFTDQTLTPGERAAVATGLVVHEVGHIRHTRHMIDAINPWRSNEATFTLAQQVLNLAEDVRDERLMREEYPGVGRTLDHTMTWMAAFNGQTAVPLAARSGFGRAVAIVRYPMNVVWDPFDADEVVERAWWDAWSVRAEKAHTVPAMTKVVRDAIERIKQQEADAPKPKPEQPTQPGDEPPTEPGDEPSDETQPGDEPSDEQPSDEEPEPGDDTTAESTPTQTQPDRSDLDVTDETPVTAEKRPVEPVPDLPSCPTAIVSASLDRTLQSSIDAISKAGLDPLTGNRTYNAPAGRITVTRMTPTAASRSAVAGRVSTVGYITPAGTAPSAVDPAYTMPVMRRGTHVTLSRAIQAAKRGDPRPEGGQRRGILDRQRLTRVAVGDYRIFSSPVQPGPERIRVTVLLDASSSMKGMTDNGEQRRAVAGQTGMDLAGAFSLMPNVTAAVYAHNRNASQKPTIHDLWHTGQPVEWVGAYAGLWFDVNYDSWAIRYATDDIVDASRPGERLLLIVLSDGETDIAATRTSVDLARKAGVTVLSIAIGSDVSRSSQDAIYGRENVIETSSNPVVFARRIAEAIGRSI